MDKIDVASSLKIPTAESEMAGKLSNIKFMVNCNEENDSDLYWIENNGQ